MAGALHFVTMFDKDPFTRTANTVLVGLENESLNEKERALLAKKLSYAETLLGKSKKRTGEFDLKTFDEDMIDFYKNVIAFHESRIEELKEWRLLLKESNLSPTKRVKRYFLIKDIDKEIHRREDIQKSSRDIIEKVNAYYGRAAV